MRYRILLWLVISFVFFSLFFHVHAHGRYGSYKGARAIDGDTFYYKGKRYRIQQYNAPEKGEPGAREATRRLQRKLDSGKYRWKPVARDAYGRVIVREKPVSK